MDNMKSTITERGDYWHPDPEKDKKLGGPGPNQRAREDRAAASKPKSDPKKLKKGESYMDYAKRHGYKKSTPKKKSLLSKLLRKEAYRVLAKGDDGKRAQFSYKDEKDAKKFASTFKKATVTKEEVVAEADKKGKGSGTKDACYHKVKSRYSVWPSAYASGALVKCRKVGAANWGNSTKKEEFEGMLTFQQFQEKCWKGYEKKGMKTMFGKRYPNCVKKEEVEQVTEKHDTPKNVKGIAKELDKAVEMHKSQAKRLRKAGVSEGAAWTKKEGKNKSGGLNEKGRKSYERENPGSDLKAPSKKVGNPRRKSFCARMKGMKKKLTSAKTANDPNSRINKSLRAWNC